MIKVIPFSNFFAVIFLQQFGYPEIRITETYDIHFTRSSDAEIQQNSAELRSVSAYTTAWEMARPIIQRIPSMKAERATSSIKPTVVHIPATSLLQWALPIDLLSLLLQLAAVQSNVSSFTPEHA